MGGLEDKLFIAGPRDFSAKPDSFGFETVRTRRKYVTPKKIRSLKKQPGTDKIYAAAVTDACGNIANVIDPVVATVFSGQVLPLHWKLLETADGQQLQFSPDILAPSLYNSNYNDIIEVKSTNRSKRGSKCKKQQIAKAAFHRLNQISQGNLVGDHKYVFMRYKFPRKTGVTDYSSSEIVPLLAESIVDMVILPFNLLLYNCSFAPDEIDFSKTTSSSFPVFNFSIKQNSALARGEMDLSTITRPKIPLKNTICRSYNCDDYGSLDKDQMRLDLIDLAEYNFVNNISIKFQDNNIPVKPFPVKEYILTDPARWNFDFSKNHPNILAKLRLTNYFADQENIPIPELLKFDKNGNPDWSINQDLAATGTEDIDPTDYF